VLLQFICGLAHPADRAAAATSCPGTNLGSGVPVSFSGNTAGTANLISGASCGDGGAYAPDATFLYKAPTAGSYTIDTLGSAFDTLLYVRNGTCSGGELACNDDSNGTRQSQVTVELVAGQSIVVVVDGYGTASGSYNLNITSGPPLAPTHVPTTTPTRT